MAISLLLQETCDIIDNNINALNERFNQYSTFRTHIDNKGAPSAPLLSMVRTRGARRGHKTVGINNRCQYPFIDQVSLGGA